MHPDVFIVFMNDYSLVTLGYYDAVNGPTGLSEHLGYPRRCASRCLHPGMNPGVTETYRA